MVLLNRYIGRVVAEVAAPRIADIEINGVAVAVEFPHSWHLDVVPTLVVVFHGKKVRRTLVGILHPVKAPGAVEREAVGVTKVAICAHSLILR